MITTPTTATLAQFIGVDEGELSPYAGEALLQATDLMQIALGTSWNESTIATDAFKKRILSRGIVAMAEAIDFGKSFRTSAKNPYYTETIGSYSYAKASKQVAAGEDTGIEWFDVAVKLLGLGDLAGVEVIQSISIFEDDVSGYGNTTGRAYVIGPADGLPDPDRKQWLTSYKGEQ